MPLVFDIADKMRGNSVFDMARDKRQSDDLHKIRKQGLEAAEYQQDEYEANRGTRDAVNSAQKQQAIALEQQTKIDAWNQRLIEFGNIAKGANEQNYQQVRPRLKELIPDAELDEVWNETTRGEIDAMIPMVDEVARKQQHIEYLKRVSESGGANAAAATSMIEQLYQEQLRAQQEYALEVEERLAGINKDNAAAEASLALGDKRRADAENIRMETASPDVKPPPQPTKENINAARERVEANDKLSGLDDEQVGLAARRIADRARQIQDEQGVIYADALDIATREMESQLETYKEVQSFLFIDALNPDDEKTVTAKSEQGRLISDARAAIQAGADRAAVIAELEEKYGIRDADL